MRAVFIALLLLNGLNSSDYPPTSDSATSPADIRSFLKNIHQDRKGTELVSHKLVKAERERQRKINFLMILQRNTYRREIMKKTEFAEKIRPTVENFRYFSYAFRMPNADGAADILQKDYQENDYTPVKNIIPAPTDPWLLALNQVLSNNEQKDLFKSASKKETRFWYQINAKVSDRAYFEEYICLPVVSDSPQMVDSWGVKMRVCQLMTTLFTERLYFSYYMRMFPAIFRYFMMNIVRSEGKKLMDVREKLRTEFEEATKDHSEVLKRNTLIYAKEIFAFSIHLAKTYKARIQEFFEHAIDFVESRGLDKIFVDDDKPKLLLAVIMAFFRSPDLDADELVMRLLRHKREIIQRQSDQSLLMVLEKFRTFDLFDAYGHSQLEMQKKLKPLETCRFSQNILFYSFLNECFDILRVQNIKSHLMRRCRRIYALTQTMLWEIPNLCTDVQTNIDFINFTFTKVNQQIIRHYRRSTKELGEFGLQPAIQEVVKHYYDTLQLAEKYREHFPVNAMTFNFFYTYYDYRNKEIFPKIMKELYIKFIKVFQSGVMASDSNRNAILRASRRLRHSDKVRNMGTFSGFRIEEHLKYNCMQTLPDISPDICDTIFTNFRHPFVAKFSEFWQVTFVLMSKLYDLLASISMRMNNEMRIKSLVLKEMSEELKGLLERSFDRWSKVGHSILPRMMSRRQLMVVFLVEVYKANSLDHNLPDEKVIEKLNLKIENMITLDKIFGLIDIGASESLRLRGVTETGADPYANYVGIGWVPKDSPLRSKNRSLNYWRGNSFNLKLFVGNMWSTTVSLDFTRGLNFLSQFIVDANRLSDDQLEHRMLFKSVTNSLLQYSAARLDEVCKKETKKIYMHHDNWDPELFKVVRRKQVSKMSQLMALCETKSGRGNCHLDAGQINIVYEKCEQGSERFDNLNCVSSCNSNFVSSQLSCKKPKAYIRKVYKDRLECGEQCQPYNNFYWLPVCKPGFKELLFFCVPVCSSNEEDRITRCQKTHTKSVSLYF